MTPAESVRRRQIVAGEAAILLAHLSCAVMRLLPDEKRAFDRVFASLRTKASDADGVRATLLNAADVMDALTGAIRSTYAPTVSVTAPQVAAPEEPHDDLNPDEHVGSPPAARHFDAPPCPVCPPGPCFAGCPSLS